MSPGKRGTSHIASLRRETHSVTSSSYGELGREDLNSGAHLAGGDLTPTLPYIHYLSQSQSRAWDKHELRIPSSVHARHLEEQFDKTWPITNDPEIVLISTYMKTYILIRQQEHQINEISQLRHNNSRDDDTEAPISKSRSRCQSHQEPLFHPKKGPL